MERRSPHVACKVASSIRLHFNPLRVGERLLLRKKSLGPRGAVWSAAFAFAVPLDLGLQLL